MPPESVAPKASYVVHLLSDSTGNLAHHLLTALLTQFPGKSVEVRRHNFLTSATLIRELLAEMLSEKTLVMHTVVSLENKTLIEQLCAAKGIPCCDLTEPFVRFLSEHTELEPSRDVARVHDLSDEYLARIEALEFTTKHDDGLGLSTLSQAEVVLVGVSRTSKTPTSIFLAQKGFKVANVSLAIENEPPKELLELRDTKVVGLTIDAMRLYEIRTARQQGLRVSSSSYSKFEHIEEELAWCRKLFRQKGWPTIDVTRNAVEETAAKVIQVLGLQDR